MEDLHRGLASVSSDLNGAPGGAFLQRLRDSVVCGAVSRTRGRPRLRRAQFGPRFFDRHPEVVAQMEVGGFPPVLFPWPIARCLARGADEVPLRNAADRQAFAGLYLTRKHQRAIRAWRSGRASRPSGCTHSPRLCPSIVIARGARARLAGGPSRTAPWCASRRALDRPTGADTPSSSTNPRSFRGGRALNRVRHLADWEEAHEFPGDRPAGKGTSLKADRFPSGFSST